MLWVANIDVSLLLASVSSLATLTSDIVVPVMYVLEVILTHVPIPVVPMHALYALACKLLARIVVLGTAFTVESRPVSVCALEWRERIYLENAAFDLSQVSAWGSGLLLCSDCAEVAMSFVREHALG